MSEADQLGGAITCWCSGGNGGFHPGVPLMETTSWMVCKVLPSFSAEHQQGKQAPRNLMPGKLSWLKAARAGCRLGSWEVWKEPQFTAGKRSNPRQNLRKEARHTQILVSGRQSFPELRTDVPACPPARGM